MHPHAIGYLTVDGIQHHMNDQANPDPTGFGMHAQPSIDKEPGPLMQRMKANTAALRIVDGIR